MNYWAIPSEKKIFVFKPFVNQSKRKPHEAISICPNNGVIYFCLGASEMMDIAEKDKINFIIMDDCLLLYKSKEGVTIRKGNKAKNLLTQSKTLGNFLKEALSKRGMNCSRSYKCGIKKTNSEFDGNTLFEIDFSAKIKSAIKGNLNN